MNNKILFPALILVILVQLFIPGKMIYDKEKTIKYGKVYKFRTAPVDPNDPFRGKYVQLGFSNNSYQHTGEDIYNTGDEVYVVLSENSDGYAEIAYLEPSEPEYGEDNEYFKAKIGSIYKNEIYQEITINFPFDRYYMEESKAYPAEKLYRKSSRDTNSVAYAVVAVDKGTAVLQHVMINDKTLEELLEEDAEP
ncbi:MAG: GDYXXLXY domain-containing protein [Bacteroidales bacterium]|nr:GDYXXLXY domain-containing protein [Bacteroidales bacterium]